MQPILGAVGCEEGFDPLRELVRHPSSVKVIAAAVELTKNKDGSFSVAEHADADGVLEPSVGVVMQSWNNFFRPLNSAKPDNRVIRAQSVTCGECPTSKSSLHKAPARPQQRRTGDRVPSEGELMWLSTCDVSRTLGRQL